MLADVVDVLADPETGNALRMDPAGTFLVALGGKPILIAEPGYVIATPGLQGEPSSRDGDDATMVAARETFLSSGHFGPFVEAVTEAVHSALDDAGIPEEGGHPVIVDVGAGTGYYLSHTLDDVQGARGIGVDVSAPAATKLTGCHPRAAAMLADVGGMLPIATSSVDVITAVFAPLNVAECARMLTSNGQLVTLTAVPGHLGELRAPLGIKDVDPGAITEKQHTIETCFTPVPGARQLVEFTMRLDQQAIATQIGMSPSAQHIEPELLKKRVRTLPNTMVVTARAVLNRYRRSQGA